MSAPTSSVRPWAWIPTLYFAQGVPYVVVMTLSTVVYKNLGVSNTDIALYTSWLYLPWVIKPLWSPLVDMFGTKRRWIVTLQFMVGVALALVALTLPGPEFFRLSLAVFWLMAFSSATHDIAADGFYLLAMPAGQQSAFVGVRSTFYRLATLSAQGGLVYLAGRWQESTGSITQSWALVFGLLAAVFIAAGVYHAFALPRPPVDRPTAGDGGLGQEGEQVGVGPVARLALQRWRIGEALMAGARTADHAVKIGSDLVGPALGPIVAGGAAFGDGRAGHGVGGGDRGREIGQRLGCGCGGDLGFGFRLYARNDIAGFRRFGRFVNRLTRDMYDLYEQDRGDDAAEDLGPFIGIHQLAPRRRGTRKTAEFRSRCEARGTLPSNGGPSLRRSVA